MEMRYYKNQDVKILANKKRAIRRKAKNHRELGIFPLWKAEMMIRCCINSGLTYEESEAMILDVIDELGQKLANHGNSITMIHNKNNQK